MHRVFIYIIYYLYFCTRKMIHEESKLQSACYRWFNLQYREYYGLAFSVPNGAKVSQSQARVLRAEGLTSGVADMILLMPRHGYHGLMIEFKTAKGRQSDTQKHFQRMVESQGYLYCIVRSCVGFMDLINAYVGEGSDSDNLNNIIKGGR